MQVCQDIDVGLQQAWLTYENKPWLWQWRPLEQRVQNLLPSTVKHVNLIKNQYTGWRERETRFPFSTTLYSHWQTLPLPRSCSNSEDTKLLRISTIASQSTYIIFLECGRVIYFMRLCSLFLVWEAREPMRSLAICEKIAWGLFTVMQFTVTTLADCNTSWSSSHEKISKWSILTGKETQKTPSIFGVSKLVNLECTWLEDQYIWSIQTGKTLSILWIANWKT